MPNLYGQKLAGYDERQQYRDASMGVGQLNQRSPAITARAPGEALSARLGNIQMGRQLEDDTFRVRGAQAQMAYQNVQNRGAQLGYQALQDAQRTGNWDMYNNRLQDIAGWQNQATQGIGARSMQQFGGQTLSNFGRRVNLGGLMTAANTQNAEQIMNWAKIALGVQQQDREFAMDQRRYADDLAYRDRAFQDRALDRQDDQAWRQMQYDRQLQNDQYDQKQDRRLNRFRRDSLKFDQEDTLVRRGHSPEAIQAYLNGDRSLVDTELKQGLSEGTGLSRRSGLSGVRRGELSAEDQVYMRPADNDALIRRKLKQAGLDSVFVGPEGMPDDDAYKAFQQQLPVSFEKTGNKDEALRDAIRTVAPERYVEGVVKGFGVDNTDMVDMEAFSAQVDEATSRGIPPRDAEALSLVDAIKRQPGGQAYVKSIKPLMDAYGSAMKRLKSMDSESESVPAKDPNGALPERKTRNLNPQSIQTPDMPAATRKPRGRISFGLSDKRSGRAPITYGNDYAPNSNPDAQKKFLSKMDSQRKLNAQTMTDAMTQGMESLRARVAEQAVLPEEPQRRRFGVPSLLSLDSFAYGY